jgi:hypothetical protein
LTIAVRIPSPTLTIAIGRVHSEFRILVSILVLIVRVRLTGPVQRNFKKISKKERKRVEKGRSQMVQRKQKLGEENTKERK